MLVILASLDTKTGRTVVGVQIGHKVFEISFSMKKVWVVPGYARSINRRVVVQDSLGLNVRPYTKKKHLKQRGLGKWLKW
jgi:hypothetical protein